MYPHQPNLKSSSFGRFPNFALPDRSRFSTKPMAFLLNNSDFLSQLRTQSQKLDGSNGISRRGFHTDLGAREKALLAEDPALRRFKSHKKDVRRIKKVGEVLTIVVAAGCFYEIYSRATN